MLYKQTRNGTRVPFLFFFFLLLCPIWAQAETIATYLTLAQDPLHEISVNWITTPDDGNDSLEYHANDEHGWHEVEGTHFPLPYGCPYTLHRVNLSQLQPDTEYTFRYSQEDKNVVTRQYKFKTMPVNLKEPLRFIVGGDIYHDSIHYVEEMNRVVAEQSPSFVLLGGDIAYASRTFWLAHDNMQRWIDFFIAWSDHMVTPEGRLIPLQATIGNHEVNGGFGQTPLQALAFYSFFVKTGNKSYGVLDFADYLSIVYLDSGHTNAVLGNQTKWLNDTLQERVQVKKKFAIYHVPAFPSYRDYKDARCKVVRQNWSPLFEKYQLVSAFENHDHCYKRTLPIFKEQVHPNGVVYVGDGAWGVKKPRKPKTVKNTWFLAKSQCCRNVVVVDLTEDKSIFRCIDNTGRVIDKFER